MFIRTVITTTVLAASLWAATPAVAQGETSRLVQDANGVLRVETGASFSSFGETVIAEGPVVQTAPAFVPTDAMYSRQYAHQVAQTETVWNTYKGDGITVGVLDTGVDVNHVDFEGRVVEGYRALGSSHGDQHGHGTHVAGIIGAGDNNLGTVGIAPNVTIWSGKVTRDNGYGNSTLLAEGIIEAINAGVDVINISMTATEHMPVVSAAIDQANAAGIPVIAAAGNEGTKGSPALYPAADANTIAVGASTINNTVAPYSNTGSYVDLVAPGNMIISSAPGNNMAWKSGTSMASPVVAGAAALIKQANPTITVDALKAALVNTATDAGTPGRDDQYGAGIINIAKAIQAAGGNIIENATPAAPVFTPFAAPQADKVNTPAVTTPKAQTTIKATHFVRPRF